MKISVIGLLVSAFGLGMSACAVESDTVDETYGEDENVGEAEGHLVTCTTDCSVTGGSSITKTCTTCSADSGSSRATA